MEGAMGGKGGRGEERNVLFVVQMEIFADVVDVDVAIIDDERQSEDVG